MNHSKTQKKFFFMLCLFFNFQIFASTYQVLNSIGDPVVSVDENKKIILNKKTIIESDFKLKTNHQQFVQMNLNQSYEISVLNDSEIFVQSVYTKEGFPSLSVQFISGQISVLKLKNANSRLQLKSDFFDWDLDIKPDSLKSDLNLWIQFDPGKPKIQFCNGSETGAEISLFDHEKKINLKHFESVIFNGQLSGGKIDFDILLKGRKIPKGHWMDKTKCTFDELNQIQKNILKSDQAEKLKKSLIIKKAQILKKNNDSKFLCHNPYGQLNDCAWVKSGEKCQRTRCDAQGKWSDLQIFSIDKSQSCKSVPVVLPCGY